MTSFYNQYESIGVFYLNALISLGLDKVRFKVIQPYTLPYSIGRTIVEEVY